MEVVLPRHAIETSYALGTVRRVVQHDGSMLLLSKPGDTELCPGSAALEALNSSLR